MQISAYNSTKIRVLSTILAYFIILLHCYNITGNSGVFTDSNRWVQTFFSQGVCRIAVPFYFIVSGFLFFRDFNWSTAWFLKKYKSRVHSLVIPYVLWGLLCTVSALPLIIIANHVAGRDILANTFWHGFSWLTINGLFGITAAPQDAGHL